MAQHLQNSGKHQRSTKRVPTGGLKADKYFHRIHVMVPYGLSDTKRYRPAQLFTLMEKLVESNTSYAGMTNKQWWSAHVGGGMHAIGVEQQESGFVIHYYLVTYNQQPELSQAEKASITARLKALEPTALVEFELSGPEPIRDHMEIGAEILNIMLLETQVYTDSQLYQSMGRDFDAFCKKVVNSEAGGFGGLLQLVREMKNRC